MKIQFIAQGIPESVGTPAGDVINNALFAADYDSFAAFVAFVSVDGINQLKEGFNRFIEDGGQIRLYVGVDLHGTSKEALELLLSLDNIQTYIVYSSNRIVYHPKIYSFEGDNKNMVMVGSSNLTMSGLYQNIEASLCITSEDEDEQDKSLISDIYDYYNAVLLNGSTYCQPLSREIIALLCDNKVVLTSKESRAQFNEQNKQNKTSVSDREKLKEKFSAVKIGKAKTGRKKSVVEHVYTKDGNNEAGTYARTISIDAYAMWIETKEMTGGSRNILDLSKKGVRDNISKPGSVEFFGVNKENYAMEKDIELVYDGKIFKNNTIKYAPRNSNWRIQIKGEADDGTKMTYLSSPRLGIPGGLTRKILIFERTDVDDRYILHIFEEDELEYWRSVSSDWANMGNRNGRTYGYLNQEMAEK